MCRAQTGDEEPAKKDWSSNLKALKITWLVAHLGIKYGHHPLLRVEIKKWIACLLHANLPGLTYALQTASLTTACSHTWASTARRRSRALRSKRCWHLRECGSRKVW
jgi:hypothetical protein